MRRAIAVLGLLLLLPGASADQSLTLGPATIGTMNAELGDDCDGSNGYRQREARVHVDDPRPNGGTKDVVVGGYCSTYDDGSFTFSSSAIYAYYSDHQFGQQGPSAYYQWYGGNTNGASYCASYLSMGSTTFMLGCPSPDGSAPPALPALP